MIFFACRLQDFVRVTTTGLLLCSVSLQMLSASLVCLQECGETEGVKILRLLFS